MKKLSALVVFLAATAPALAQNTPVQTAQATGLYTCWYNGAGKLTSAEPATDPNARVHYVVLTGRGGDQAWAYDVRSSDGHECPKFLPHS